MTYLDIEHFRDTDYDKSSYPVRDRYSNKSAYSINLFPELLSFEGSIEVETSPQAILVQNDGFKDLPVVDVIVVGPFTLKTTKPTVLVSGSTISLEVTYTGKSVGPMTGGLFIQVPNAIGRTFIPLYGEAV